MDFDDAKQPGEEWKRKTYIWNGKPLVTIVTPFYNAGTYFEQVFYSVMNQTFPWFEWIIVDDGSDSKKDLKVLAQFIQKDSRISVVRQKNHGLAAARNTGIQKAQTEIIIPLDADDLLAPQYLEYTYFGLYFNKDAAWCYTDSVGFGSQEYLWRYPWNAKKMKKINLLTATAAIRKNAFKSVGGYHPEKWAYHEDWRFWLELLAKHQYPVHVKGYLFWYRRSEDGMLAEIRAERRKRQFCRKIIKKAAKKADGSIQAVEYPIVKTKEPYHCTKFLKDWADYKVTADGNKIKVLLLVPWLEMGGADRFNLALVAGLDKSRFEVAVLTTVPSEHRWQSMFAEYTDEIFHLPDFLDPAYYMEYVSYYIQTRNVNFVLVTNSYRGYYMVPWLRKQFPDLCITDYVHMEEWYWKAGGFARVCGMFGTFLEKTYVCSSHAKEVLTDIFHRNQDEVTVRYVGVDEQRFDAKNVKRGRLYKMLQCTEDVPIVLFPCRIDPQKRPFLMLAVAKKVIRQIPKVMFVVVGDGPQRRALEKEIKRRRLWKNVHCIGQIGNMEECYQDASITLICSIKEGLSLTAYESCAMGTPVVSSDVGGQSDLIDDTVGILVPVRQSEGIDFDKRIYAKKEVDDYARAVIKLLSDSHFYKNCAEGCRRKIEGKFTMKQMLKSMEQEITVLVRDEKKIQRRKELSDKAKEFGFLTEELYLVEMAEEERSMASAAVLAFLEQAMFKYLPQGSVRRDQVLQFYRKWRSKG